MKKPVNIALFGFGRIGRNIFRLGYDNPNYKFVAVSDFGSAEALHYLLSRDSVHGSMKEDVKLEKNHLVLKINLFELFKVAVLAIYLGMLLMSMS